MKKWMSFLCVLSLFLTLAGMALAITPDRVTAAFHDEETMTYGPEETVEVVNVLLDGERMESDMPAISQTVDGQDHRTLVPVRPIAEALGAQVNWLEEERQVEITAGEDRVVLTLGSAEALVNGQKMTLPGGVPAMAARCGEVERTLVPLRFVSEQLHAQVEWDNDAYAALVTAPTGEVRPPRGRMTRIAADDNAQTITIYLSAAPEYRVTDLGDRVVIDLLGVEVGGGKDGSLRPENPVVSRVRYAQHGSDIDPREERTTRVVLDLAKGCTYGENVTVLGDANLRAVVVSVSPPETGAELPQEPELDPAAFTVVLDAGHGGSALGARYEGVNEKDLTLPVTLRAAQLLREKGFNVVLTRSEDVYVDLYDRCDIANNAKGDIFVSIHANASETNLDFQGTFTYSYPKSVEGERLAGYVQKAVVEEIGSVDRGLLTNDYVVLRETYMPAVLLEMGFMSCHEELERLVQPEYREKVAQGVARGVEQYLATLPQKDGRTAGAEGVLLPPGE